MPLPDLNVDGDLPPGIHRATMDEVIARFGGQGTARQRCTKNLKHIYELANGTGQLERLVIRGTAQVWRECVLDQTIDGHR